MTLYFGIAASSNAGSGFVITTTVPPRAVQGTESRPAVCVIGAAARLTGLSSEPYGQPIMKCAQKVCMLRWVFITPFGLPVVPPVAPRKTTSSMSTATFGRVAGCSPAQLASERAPGKSGSSSSMQIHSRIFGRRGRNSATTGAKYFWKNSTSQSKASST